MALLKFEFSRKWLEKLSDDFENPIGRMEKFVCSFDGVRRTFSSSESFYIEVEEEKSVSLLIYFLEFCEEEFGDLNGQPGNEMKVFHGDEELLENMQMVRGLLEAAAVEHVDEEDFEAQVNRLMQESHILKDNPALYKYVNETKHLILTLKDMKADEYIWSKKLLVSMDSGYGYSEFLRVLRSVYTMAGLLHMNDEERLSITEVSFKREQSEELDEKLWNKLLTRLRSEQEIRMMKRRYSAVPKEVAEQLKEQRPVAVYSIDLSDWYEKASTAKMAYYLRKIAEYTSDCMCVFRIPLFEEPEVRKIEKSINNSIPVKAVIAYPPSNEAMAVYLKQAVEKRGFTFRTDPWNEAYYDEKAQEAYRPTQTLDALERWIGEEKRKPTFYGYKSLDLMAERLIYKKAENNMKQRMSDAKVYMDETIAKGITLDEIYGMLENPNERKDPWEELDSLIGLDEVKEAIRKQVKAWKKTMQSANRPTLHMSFTGNPGTGKTTVARIVARILEKEQILRKGHYTEVHGRDLCGDHIGETSIITKRYCRDAIGSVLFIDEAYSLGSPRDSRDFGHEAVSVLIQQMENHRSEMCVILAGYDREMEDLMKINTGFSSRLTQIAFPSYSRKELAAIFMKLLEAGKRNGELAYQEEEMQTEVEKFFLAEEMLPESLLKSKEFSNARYVRNLFQDVRGEAISRTGLQGTEDEEGVLEIIPEDFKSVTVKLSNKEEQERINIGFR